MTNLSLIIQGPRGHPGRPGLPGSDNYLYYFGNLLIILGDRGPRGPRGLAGPPGKNKIFYSLVIYFNFGVQRTEIVLAYYFRLVKETCRKHESLLVFLKQHLKKHVYDFYRRVKFFFD